MSFKMIHENYNVQDLQKSITFYREAFGLIEVRRKEAEDGSGDLVLRMTESAGWPCKTGLWLHGREERMDLSFTPFEIKTVRIAGDGSVRETNLLEEEP